MGQMRCCGRGHCVQASCQRARVRRYARGCVLRSLRDYLRQGCGRSEYRLCEGARNHRVIGRGRPCEQPAACGQDPRTARAISGNEAPPGWPVTTHGQPRWPVTPARHAVNSAGLPNRTSKAAGSHRNLMTGRAGLCRPPGFWLDGPGRPAGIKNRSYPAGGGANPGDIMLASSPGTKRWLGRPSAPSARGRADRLRHRAPLAGQGRR
jgi:hypothetical protein